MNDTVIVRGQINSFVPPLSLSRTRTRSFVLSVCLSYLGVRADSLVAAHFAMTEVVVVVLLFFISVVGGLLPSPPS